MMICVAVFLVDDWHAKNFQMPKDFPDEKNNKYVSTAQWQRHYKSSQLHNSKIIITIQGHRSRNIQICSCKTLEKTLEQVAQVQMLALLLGCAFLLARDNFPHLTSENKVIAIRRGMVESWQVIPRKLFKHSRKSRNPESLATLLHPWDLSKRCTLAAIQLMRHSCSCNTKLPPLLSL